ncbi:2776_t:CDS:1 [Funneliformis mosseae]|uniref:2776_t:CDS:1 n=1 Tax=Funneliformis mosseae TaxID=27381 RepID=A0A9N9FL87_FUNMO|nr:2776_t:CDS:1 [Funneliformis mosseae]
MSFKTFIFLIFATSILMISKLSPKTFNLKKLDHHKKYPNHESINHMIFLQKRLESGKILQKNPGISVAQQEATSQTLENDTYKHYEEESEDWWEVYRSYEYETTDNLENLFRVEVEEAQVIHKQHAKLYDLQVAEVRTQDTASQGELHAGVGFQQDQANYDSNTIDTAGIEQNQQQDLLDVKQYQRVHVLQYAATGMIIREYEEERLAEYQYQLELDVFNQWEYHSENENQQSSELALGLN